MFRNLDIILLNMIVPEFVCVCVCVSLVDCTFTRVLNSNFIEIWRFKPKQVLFVMLQFYSNFIENVRHQN